MNAFLIVFNIGFNCDIFTNIHAGIYCYSYYSCNIKVHLTPKMFFR